MRNSYMIRGNYCVLSEYHKYVLPSFTWMVGLTSYGTSWKGGLHIYGTSWVPNNFPCDMAADVAQHECSNNKCYASTFRYNINYVFYKRKIM